MEVCSYSREAVFTLTVTLDSQDGYCLQQLLWTKEINGNKLCSACICSSMIKELCVFAVPLLQCMHSVLRCNNSFLKSMRRVQIMHEHIYANWMFSNPFLETYATRDITLCDCNTVSDLHLLVKEACWWAYHLANKALT